MAKGTYFFSKNFVEKAGIHNLDIDLKSFITDSISVCLFIFKV
ncbi:MAG: hypothetical protein RBT49_00775 [Bacteroidales bacterium]|jgi:hypothetical protein|nr:hypothetical protein [Bacteroidales bacterium]